MWERRITVSSVETYPVLVILGCAARLNVRHVHRRATSVCCFLSIIQSLAVKHTRTDDQARSSYICEARRHCHGKSHYPKDPSPLLSTPFKLLAPRWLTSMTLT